MKYALTIGLLALLPSLAYSQENPNLAQDASFESPLPPWFAEAGRGAYHAAKNLSKDAVEGKFVLAIRGWRKPGARILSPVLDLKAESYSATARVRVIGTVHGVEIELALFDAGNKKKLASFGKRSVKSEGAWEKISKADVRISERPSQGHLALVVSGPQRGSRVEVDLVGLFAGPDIGIVRNNADFVYFEAEELADGKLWVVKDHYVHWYPGLPNRMKMLAGWQGVKDEDNKPVSRVVVVRHPGRHTLWIRHLTVNHVSNAGRFTVALHQNGKMLASKEIYDADEKLPKCQWVWSAVDADLAAGRAEIVLTRPSRGVSWISRKLDLFALTNQTAYRPIIQHFRPKGYMRFVNRSEGVEPFCLYVHVRRHQRPLYFGNPGIVNLAGNSRGYYVLPDRDRWLAPGDTSPWIRISDDLLPGGGRNNVTITATREMHTKGFVEGRIRGVFEFALGDERKIIKILPIDQNAPRVSFALPYDFEEKPDEIRGPRFFIKEKQALLARIGKPRGRRAKHLDLSAILEFRSGTHDPAVIKAEVDIIKRMGFTNPYYAIAPSERLLDFYREHDLEPRFILPAFDSWAKRKEKSMHHPDAEALGLLFERWAETHAPIMDHMGQIKLMDEPGGMSYAAILESSLCRAKFADELKARGMTPQELGVAGWDQVVPVGPEGSDRHPELFYHTALFRLRAMPTFMQACTQAKNKAFNGRGFTTVNYSPPNSGGSWTIRGTDPFFCQRGGALELAWTEDWLAHGAGPQHLSDILSLLRGAGRPTDQPIGAYLIGQGTPDLIRMKFYTLIAGGARRINVYCYGPWYAGIDSWSRKFDLYPPIMTCLHELGTIDEALKNTKRRKADVAILYNRTSAIWAKGNYTAEQNNWYTHWALAHAGYDADFLPEEDVEAGALARYRAFYLSGVQLRRKTANAVAGWVQDGGVLFGSAGSGSRDEYNRPMSRLQEVFGAASSGLELVQNVGRPKYELRALKVLDELTSVPGLAAPSVRFRQLGFREVLAPSEGAVVILKNRDGRPAGTVRKTGRGTAIRVAAMPGIAYLNDAVREKEYDIDSYLPKQFRRQLRDFIAWPAMLAGAARVAATPHPITEIVRYDGPGRAVVVVIDHEAEPRKDFSFSLPDAAQFKQAYAASGSPVTLRPDKNGKLTVTLPLTVADAVVLQE